MASVWIGPTVGAGIAIGGSSGDVQYNNAGDLGGFGDWDGSLLTVPGSVLLGDDGTFSYLTTGTRKFLSIGDAGNVATGTGALGQVTQIGNGLSVTHADGGIDNVTQIGASLVRTLTNSGSLSDSALLGEHVTSTDENGESSYVAAINGGAGDIHIRGGGGWFAAKAGAGGDIDADFFESSSAIGDNIEINVGTPNPSVHRRLFLTGHDITTTDSGNLSATGEAINLDTIVGPAAFHGYGHSANDASEVFFYGASHDNGGFSRVFAHGESLVATGNQQAWYGGGSLAVFFQSSATGFNFAGGSIALANGLALRGSTTDAETYKFSVYDVNGTAYVDWATITNGNTPSVVIAPPAGGTTIEVQATTYKSSDGTSGATAGPFSAITSIQVKNGLVTTLTGT